MIKLIKIYISPQHKAERHRKIMWSSKMFAHPVRFPHKICCKKNSLVRFNQPKKAKNLTVNIPISMHCLGSMYFIMKVVTMPPIRTPKRWKNCVVATRMSLLQYKSNCVMIWEWFLDQYDASTSLVWTYRVVNRFFFENFTRNQLLTALR